MGIYRLHYHWLDCKGSQVYTELLINIFPAYFIIVSAFEGLVTYVLKRTYFYNKVFAFEVGAFLSYLVFDLSLKEKSNC